MSQSRSRQLRRAGGRPRPAGTPNGARVYEGHMVEVVPEPGGTEVAVVVGLGPLGGAPRAVTCLCPHQAVELADALRAAAMEHIGQCHGPT